MEPVAINVPNETWKYFFQVPHPKKIRKGVPLQSIFFLFFPDFFLKFNWGFNKYLHLLFERTQPNNDSPSLCKSEPTFKGLNYKCNPDIWNNSLVKSERLHLLTLSITCMHMPLTNIFAHKNGLENHTKPSSIFVKPNFELSLVYI